MKKTALILLSAVLLLASCKTTRTQRGAVIGAGTGAAIGGVIGNATGNTGVGVAIGTVVGGVAGTIIGKQMDKQANEIKNQIPNAEVIHTQGDQGILVNFNSKVLFATAKYDLNESSKSSIRDLAVILNKYPDTDINIQGHTDSQGADAFNQTLSENRANAVANYLKGQGIATSRIITKGYGETEPVASNATEEGRQQNRRVAFVITPNQKMIDDAKKQSN